MKVNLLTLFFLVSFLAAAQAQQKAFVPEGQFLKDSLAVGEHVFYSLKYTYPRETNLVFPDSAYDFFPLDYVDKKFFPTRENDGFLTDSAVYTLTTFEIAPVLYLSVPVFVLEDGDSTRYFANIDSVHFRQMIDTLPQTPKMRSNTAYVKVSENFNYIYFSIAAIVFLIVSAVVAILYGKKIANWIKIKRLKKAHKKFNKKYDALLAGRTGALDKDITGRMLKLWKSYMERLERRPFTKLTTREITFIYNDTGLNKSLKEIDRAIYSDYVPAQHQALFGNLIDFSQSRLRLKIEELKNE